MRRALAVVALFLLVTVLGVAITWGARPRVDEPPNVVLIVVDTLRHDHVSQYGYPAATSPSWDRFTQHATRFTNAYAPSSWTVPSTATIHTGLLPMHHGANKVGDILRKDLNTIAERLSAGGWSTAGFSHNIHVVKKTAFAQGFDLFKGARGRADAYPDVGKMIADVGTWISKLSGDKPRFLYMHPMNCHGPYLAPPQPAVALLGRPASKKFNYRTDPIYPILIGKLEQRERVTESYLTSLNEQYDTAIRHTSDSLEIVIDLLEQKGLYDNALVIVTSDHGEELYDHLGFSHGYSLYDEVLHVPLFVKWPRQKVGEVDDRMVSIADLYPTILEAAGLAPEPDIDGVALDEPQLSLAQQLAGLLSSTRRSEQQPKDYQLYHVAGWEERAVARAIRRGPYKYIETTQNYEGLKDARQLFRIDEDPGEQEDLLVNPSEESLRISAELAAILEAEFRDETAAPPNVSDELDEKALRALGYIRE